ncbi:MAG: phosphatase PAP2 family protein [Dehalococcoidia bacterium]
MSGRPTTPEEVSIKPRWLWAAAIVCAIVFALLTLDALTQPAAFFDPWLLRTVQRVDLPLIEPVIRPIDWLTDGPGAVLMWALTMIALAALRWWPAAAVALMTPIGGVVNFVVGRLVVDRDRPDPADFTRVIVDTNGPAYPSGHVMGAVMLYGFLFLLAACIPSRALRFAARTACLAVIVASGFGRVWYGAHWPSDVVGAYAAGGLLLIVMVVVYQRLVAGRRPERLGAMAPSIGPSERTPSRTCRPANHRSVACRGIVLAAVMQMGIPLPHNRIGPYRTDHPTRTQDAGSGDRRTEDPI